MDKNGQNIFFVEITIMNSSIKFILFRNINFLIPIVSKFKGDNNFIKKAFKTLTGKDFVIINKSSNPFSFIGYMKKRIYLNLT